MDIALADYADVAHDVDGCLAKEVELLVGEGLRRGHDDALSGVDAERIEILHVADGDAVVVGVAHDLILNLLPAAQGLFYQHLRGEGERLGGHGVEFLFVFAEAGAQTSERVGRAQDHRIADLRGCGAGLLYVGCRV